MITTTITASPDISSVEKFAVALNGYIAAHPTRVADMLIKKGNDLGIRLFHGYTEHKWGGPGKHAGLAVAEARARGASGRGTVLREKLQGIFDQGRADLTKDVRSAGQLKRTAERHGVAGLGFRQQQIDRGLVARERRATLWSKVLRTELSLRQSGIGALAASFLWSRKRSNSLGTRLSLNRTGRPIGGVTMSENGIEVRAAAGGIADVGTRYGIVDKALSESADDMFKYLADRNWEALPRP